MNVAYLSYPTLFQHVGGLQSRIAATIAAVRAAGCDVRVPNPYEESISGFDLLHVFSQGNGTFRFVQLAKETGIPVVISPVVQVERSRGLAWRKKLADRLVGKLTNYELRTTLGETREAVVRADRVIALGEDERSTLAGFYGVDPERLRIVPNGVGDRFFTATPERSLAAFDLEPGFVFVPGNVSDYKGQLRVVEALADRKTPVVLAGQCTEGNRSYLDKCLELGDGRVKYVGALDHDDPNLASLYAAAGVTALPSLGEVAPNAITESLAAGRPAIVTEYNSLDFDPSLPCYREVEPTDIPALGAALDDLLTSPPGPAECRAVVEHLRWDTVARALIDIYAEVVK